MTDIIFGREYIVKVTDDGECVTTGELIRCKDCRHYKRYSKFRKSAGMYCDLLSHDELMTDFNDDDYCSKAERKDK